MSVTTRVASRATERTATMMSSALESHRLPITTPRQLARSHGAGIQLMPVLYIGPRRSLSGPQCYMLQSHPGVRLGCA